MAKAGDITRKWYVIDAAGRPLGRLATLAATLLRGKHKPTYTPHLDTGDHVIIINAGQVVLTGKKAVQKMWYRHSMYPGGLKATPYGQLLKERPEKAIELAVKGMLPHNRLGRDMVKKLKVYAGSAHPHEAQRPEAFHGFDREEI